MKKILILMCLTILILGLVGCKKPVGSSCGTVTPGEQDACCAERNKDTEVMIMCEGEWKYVGGDLENECQFVCDESPRKETQLCDIECRYPMTDSEGWYSSCFESIEEGLITYMECIDWDKVAYKIPPMCDKIGTRSEGWYFEGEEEPIIYDFCEGCEAIAKYPGTRSEGWYSNCNNKIISYHPELLKAPFPMCKHQGSYSEGWYFEGEEEAIKFHDCEMELEEPKTMDCEAECKYSMTDSEGWYSNCFEEMEESRITYATCTVDCPPTCENIGTKSEGWYYMCKEEGERLIKYSTCDGCDAVGKYPETRSEGWYSSCNGEVIDQDPEALTKEHPICPYPDGSKSEGWWWYDDNTDENIGEHIVWTDCKMVQMK